MDESKVAFFPVPLGMRLEHQPDSFDLAVQAHNLKSNDMAQRQAMAQMKAAQTPPNGGIV